MSGRALQVLAIQQFVGQLLAAVNNVCRKHRLFVSLLYNLVQ